GTPTWSTRVTPSASSSFHSFRSTSSTPSWIVWASTWARSTWANRARSSSASTRRCTTSVWALAHTSARSFAVRLRKLSYSAASRRYLSFSSANSPSRRATASSGSSTSAPSGAGAGGSTAPGCCAGCGCSALCFMGFRFTKQSPSRPRRAVVTANSLSPHKLAPSTAGLAPLALAPRARRHHVMHACALAEGPVHRGIAAQALRVDVGRNGGGGPQVGEHAGEHELPDRRYGREAEPRRADHGRGDGIARLGLEVAQGDEPAERQPHEHLGAIALEPHHAAKRLQVAEQLAEA